MLLALTTGLPPCSMVCLCVPSTTSNAVLIASQAASNDSAPKPHLSTILSTSSLWFGSLEANTEMKLGVHCIYEESIHVKEMGGDKTGQKKCDTDSIELWSPWQGALEQVLFI